MFPVFLSLCSYWGWRHLLSQCEQDCSAKSSVLLWYLASELAVPCSLINCEFSTASALLGRCFMKISVLHKQYLLQFVLVIGIFFPAGTWWLFFSSFVGWYLILRFADLMAFCCGCLGLAVSHWSASVLVCNRDWQLYELFKIKAGSKHGEQKAAVSLKSAVWSEHQLHPPRTKAILICGAQESLTYRDSSLPMHV